MNDIADKTCRLNATPRRVNNHWDLTKSNPHIQDLPLLLPVLLVLVLFLCAVDIATYFLHHIQAACIKHYGEASGTRSRSRGAGRVVSK